MSNEKVLAALFERIEIGKSYYFEGAYYRLKDYGDHIYGLQRAIPGMCGEKTASPSIKFYWKNGVLDYQFYVDFEASPMIICGCSCQDRFNPAWPQAGMVQHVCAHQFQGHQIQ